MWLRSAETKNVQKLKHSVQVRFDARSMPIYFLSQKSMVIKSMWSSCDLTPVLPSCKCDCGESPTVGLWYTVAIVHVLDMWCKKHIVSVSCIWSPSARLPSARQHPSYDDCLEVKREYYQDCFVLDCVTHCSQSAAHLCEQFLQVQQIGFVTLGPLCCA